MRLSTFLVVAILVVAGCSSSEDNAPLRDESTSVAPTSTLSRIVAADEADAGDGPHALGIRHTGWLLVSGSVDDQAIPIEPDLVMRFGEERLGFPLACNSASVPYVVEGSSIEFDIDYFATTDMRCAPDPTIQANLFATGLPRVETVAIHEGGQRLQLEGDGVLMQFSRGTGG